MYVYQKINIEKWFKKISRRWRFLVAAVVSPPLFLQFRIIHNYDSHYTKEELSYEGSYSKVLKTTASAFLQLSVDNTY